MTRRPTHSVDATAIVVTHNEGELLKRTLSGIWASRPAGVEIVVVDDGSTDGSAAFRSNDPERLRVIRTPGVGVAKARNIGARHALGRLLAFFDGHVAVGPSFWPPVMELLQDPAIGAVAPSISMLGKSGRRGFGLTFTGPDLAVRWLDRVARGPYRVPILPGAALAMRRTTFEAAGGFDEGMIRWGSIDNEFSLRLWLLGYSLLVIPEVEVGHQFRDAHPYRVDWSWVVHNAMRLAVLHFSDRRARASIQAQLARPAAASALDLLAKGDALTRRRLYAESRIFDDEAYFGAIGLDF